MALPYLSNPAMASGITVAIASANSLDALVSSDRKASLATGAGSSPVSLNSSLFLRI